LLSEGTGALNIDGCRVSTTDSLGGGRLAGPTDMSTTCGGDGWDRPWMHDESKRAEYAAHTAAKVAKAQEQGRWPPNVLVTHHPECVEDGACHQECMAEQLKAQTGSDVTRFFPQFYYSPKASRAERETGAPEDAERVTGAEAVRRKAGSAGLKSPRAGAGRTAEDVWNNHPTLKPVDVMRWLVRLVAPPGSIVLDPFNGSGTTGVAALHEGARYVGCEREERFVEISTARLAHAEKESTGLPPVKLAPKERERTEVIPVPDSEALQRAFDLTEEIKVERKPGGLASKDFKRLVAKSLKR